MVQDQSKSQIVELVNEFPDHEGVCFDPEHITLEGVYTDQISAYRAKKVWVETLGQSFLLEDKHDFRMSVVPSPSDVRYVLRCEFLTACARYAFWRLTNNQAPEAQYIIETAHIPNAELRQDDFWQAPDMHSKHDSMLLQSLSGATLRVEENSNSIKSLLKRIIEKLTSQAAD